MQNLYKLSPYYESIIDFKTSLETEVNLLLNIFSRYGVNSVLDVACGVGRHCVELAGVGYEVTGVDYSPYQLERGEKKAVEKGVKVDFTKMDVNKLAFHKEFDAAICMWTTLCEEPLRYRDVIKGVLNSLKDRGIFVIDNRSWEHIPLSKEEEFTQSIEARDTNINVHLYDRYTENFRIREAAYTLNGDKVYDLCITHIVKENDWIEILEELGFEIAEIYHDYKDVREQAPHRVQIVARKI